MSRIEQLINELCPNGIPYVEISTLFNLRNGYTPTKSNAEYWEDGTIPWFRMEDIRDNGRILADSIQKISESAVKGGNLFPANSLLVATSATIGEHALITVPHLSNQRFTSLALKLAYSDQLDMKFVFYYGFILAEWCRNNTTMSSFASVDMSKFRRFKFPIPPLDVQCEIVKILDTFSALEGELEAELEARQQQYEHYQNLLTEPFVTDKKLKKGWQSAKLGDISRIEKGKTPIQKAVPGEYPLVATTRERQSSADFQFDAEAVCIPLISSRGHGVASISRIYYQSGKFALGNILCAVIPTDPTEVSAAFLRYFLYSRKDFLLVPLMRGGANVSLTIDSLKSVRVQFPSLQEQHQIVEILNKFETFVNDSEVGLPAEITARRQQYEYYREQLLTFRELGGSA